MGSRRQNTDEPPSMQAAATQDWGLSRVLSFQYKNFTHFNGHYNFKESNFHHCLSSASWFVERGSLCMNPAQKPAFPPGGQRSFYWYLSLRNYRSNCWTVACFRGISFAMLRSKTRPNLIINKICTLKRLLKWKGKDEQKGGGGGNFTSAR